MALGDFEGVGECWAGCRVELRFQGRLICCLFAAFCAGAAVLALPCGILRLCEEVPKVME